MAPSHALGCGACQPAVYPPGARLPSGERKGIVDVVGLASGVACLVAREARPTCVCVDADDGRAGSEGELLVGKDHCARQRRVDGPCVAGVCAVGWG